MSGMASNFPIHVPTRSAVRGRRPGIRAIKDLALVICACVAFIIAKSMTTQGRVRIDQFEYWMIGTIPFLVLFAYVLVDQKWIARRPLNQFAIDTEARTLCIGWVLALGVFIFARETHYYELVRSLAFDHFHISRAVAEWAMSFAVVSVGLVGAYSISALGNRTLTQQWSAYSFLVVLTINTLMFETLIYWLR